jgi:2,3-bisphosphoglycerate-independent phosphoglycerate mutase
MLKDMRIAWLMLDGVGLRQPDDSDCNPLQQLDVPTLEKLGITTFRFTQDANLTTRAIDANLEIPGLPQSGTGQTTILTGINAAQQIGFHHGPWVSPSLRPILEHNILKKIGDVRLANFYPLPYLESLKTGKRKLNAIATSALSGGAKLEGESGLAISPLLRGFEQDSNPEQITAWAKSFMASTSKITIFDLWWTDSVGHEMDLTEAQALVLRLELFCTTCLEYKDSETLFLITSDHGNFEDLRVKTHTRNPVPLAAVGTSAPLFASISSLTDIANAVLNTVAV